MDYNMRVLNGLYKVLRWGLGIVFIYAGGTKLAGPETFSVLIEAYGIVPEMLLMPTRLTGESGQL